MMRPATTTLYAVYWPAEGDGIGVLKVGREQTDTRRKLWMRRGAELVALFVGVPARWERAIHKKLRARFLPAFDSEQDAKWLLGGGYGYTECFIIPEESRAEALHIIASAIAEESL